ncbi:MAG: outer membrane lipoprotein-sorting protein [Bacteroidetes bacterium]|nr:outer membrane lipoprotein-sorting protein [Bacteroidota bacterium]
MKKLFLALFPLVSLLTNAQTADEVIQKYTAAMGGLDAFKKVQTAKFTGTVSVRGYDLPMTIQIINGRAMRSDVDAMGQAVINVYKDGKGWAVNPFNGMETATDVEGAELLNLKAQASLVNALMDNKSQGHTVELQGQEAVEGITTWKIKLTTKEDGRIVFYYISNADNYLIKVTNTREIQGQETEVETWFSDLKEFAGLKFYMTRTQKTGGQTLQTIAYSNVELNVPVDEKIFDK